MSVGVPALSRGLEILRMVSERGDCVSAVLERELAIPKASLQRLIDTMVGAGALAYVEGGKRLRIGDALTAIVSGAYENDSLVSLTKPMLKRLAEIRERSYAYQEGENAPSMKQLAVPLEIRGSKAVYSLGCFLPMDYERTEPLREAMQLESARFRGNE